jgi:translocator protein
MKSVPTVTPRSQVAVAALWAAAGACVVILLGQWVTDLGPWYRALKQPDWKPADLWFGPVWTLIFTLSATAAVKAWFGCTTRRQQTALVAAFILNGALNVLWSWLFFRLRRPDWAVLEVVLLWLSIVLLIVLTARANTTAAWLLVPYLVWVAFAAGLNLAVVRLNAPF